MRAYTAELDAATHEGPFHAAGDLNVQVHKPRGEEDRDLVNALGAAWHTPRRKSGAGLRANSAR